MNPRTASAAACLVAALASFGAEPARAQRDGDLPEQLRVIATVKFKGLKKLGKRELKTANLKTRKPSVWPWRERPSLRLDYLRADTAAIAALYRHYGYLDARARWVLESTADPEAARVVFVIDEGRRSKVSTLRLSGVYAYHEREVRRPLLAQPGRPFDPSFLAIDTVTIARIYQERGYQVGTAASWVRGDPDSLAIAVAYDIVEGPQHTIGRIDVEGTGGLRESLARRELLLRPGDVFRRSRLEQSVQRLYDTGLYSQVQVSSVEDSVPGVMDLRLRVAARRPRWVDLGIGSGSADLFSVSGAWGHRNLDTKALLGSLTGDLALDRQRRDALQQSQALRVRHGRLAANLVEPWLLGLRLQGQVTLFYEEASDDRDVRFLQHRDSRGIELGLLREFSHIFRGSITGHSALVHQRYDIFLSTPDDTRDLFSKVLQRYFDNGVTMTLVRDTRDDRITPVRGSLQSLNGETAGGLLAGSSSYRKVHLTSIWYTPRANGWGWAFRGSAGAMSARGDAPSGFSPGVQDAEVARVPRERRFFLGGVNSLRGWGENSIPADGGLAMVLANAEVRVPLLGPFGAEAFVDMGNVWAQPEHMRFADIVAPWSSRRGGAGDLRWSYGVGARLLLPFGPLRMDVAWSTHPDFPSSRIFGRMQRFNYQFAIGPSF